MIRKPTMHDVARAAGVGTMTVSRVLNGSQHVAKETADRVKRAVTELGYHPNEMARALRNFKSRTVGLIVPNLCDTFFATCAHAVNLVAKEYHYTVLITTSDDRAEIEYVEAERMMQRHVEGLLVAPAGIGQCRLGEGGFDAIPIVAMDRPVCDRVDSVVVENEQGSREAVCHLIEEHGHERILFLGFLKDLYTVRLRSDGYAQAMRAARLPLLRNYSCNTLESTAAVLKAALAEPDPPTAVFCANNMATRDVLAASLRLGISVPEDLAVVGFDDLELGDILHPALTVVRQPVAELGQRAARLLFSRLYAEPAATSHVTHTMLAVELIRRHSCGCVYARSDSSRADGLLMAARA